jgi:hypothetical protein
LQTSLEQIFVSFASQQEEETASAPGLASATASVAVVADMGGSDAATSQAQVVVDAV